MEKITNIFVKCLLSEAVTEFAERGKLKCEIDKECEADAKTTTSISFYYNYPI